MSIKFLVLGGGRGYFGFWGGGGADFIFMGARIFLRYLPLETGSQEDRSSSGMVDKRSTEAA